MNSLTTRIVVAPIQSLRIAVAVGPQAQRMRSMALLLALAAALAIAPAAQAGTVSAFVYTRYVNSSFQSAGGNTLYDTSLISNSVHTESGGVAGPLVYDVDVQIVQGYGVFHGLASVLFIRFGPYDYEVFQGIGEGVFTETLTIPAPPGIANGSLGKFNPGWDIDGILAETPGVASANLYMSARTSVPEPASSSSIPIYTGPGHYNLASPIPFYFGVPFDLTVNSSVFAGVAYDYTSDPTPPSTFEGSATADFLHTAVLSSAAITTPNGTPLPDATILITSSGNNFLASIPEPTSLAFLALLALSLSKRSTIAILRKRINAPVPLGSTN